MISRKGVVGKCMYIQLWFLCSIPILTEKLQFSMLHFLKLHEFHEKLFWWLKSGFKPIFSKACKFFNRRLKQMSTKDSYKWEGTPTFAKEQLSKLSSLGWTILQ